MQVNEGRVAVDDDAGVLQAEERDEQADTGGDRSLDSLRNGVENHAAQAGDGQEDENDTVNKNHDQRVCIGEAHANTDGVYEECVQTHAGGLRKRKIRQQSDQDGADHGGKCGCNINCAVTYAENVRAVTEGVGEHVSVDHQNVGHCHERGNTGEKFSFYCCTMFLQSKELFHEIPPLFIPPRGGFSVGESAAAARLCPA